MLALDTKKIESCTVLIVDDDNISRTVISTILSDLCHCVTVANAQDALTYCEQHSPDLMVIDVNMPEMNGLNLCKSIKHNEKLDDIPLIFITGNVSKESQIQCWESGGNDFVSKPVVAQTLIHRVRNHLLSKLRMDALVELTFHDSLTGLLNRNYLTQEYPKLARQLLRSQQRLGVILFDVDNFKQYNDQYGHLAGDQCLQRVANILQKHARRSRDAMIRFGGEEFLAILPDTDMHIARCIAQAIVDDVNKAGIPHKNTDFGRITVSAGAVSTRSFNQDNLDEILELADVNLYEAKMNGKNRVVCK
ncbi:diguanylate cyclase [Aestuariibacter sp. GS-14]|uniref:GGDEF domain-containing response regulator n=1 Tax=Aestuariibacter sp. GS-14 TaxID=2590670 RepID=UPI00112735F9|nr:diguanylate cyclase [Aestuariibacter sp. GS-14]TPV57977.1 diguanylate cyclase [Aestuariibacter sp. GS-14]